MASSGLIRGYGLASSVNAIPISRVGNRMDSHRTRKKPGPKKHVPRGPSWFESRRQAKIPSNKRVISVVKSIGATLIAILVGLAVVTQVHAEDYYFYKGPKGELVISNNEPPPGTKIIKRLPSVTNREAPQAQEPAKPQPNIQPEGSPKPTK